MARYCFDTSALIQAWRTLYPPDVFPSFWKNLDGLMAAGEVVAPEEVLVELSKKEDDVYAWAKGRENIFEALDEHVQRITTQILNDHPKLVAELSDRQQADPFVIALAKRDGLTVVSHEKRRGNAKKPRIPNVCDAIGVPHCGLVDFLREQGWSF